jgi:hypothetical protein
MSTKEQCTALLCDSTTEQIRVVWENTGNNNPFLNALNILSQHTFYQSCFHCNAVHYPAERKQIVSDLAVTTERYCKTPQL